MHLVLTKIAFVAALLFTPLTHAELAGTPLPGDARLVTFDFDADNTYLILSKPRAVTHLEFPEGETIQTVVAGDTAGWELTPSSNLRHFFIKPKHDQTSTSMTVITEKRSYQFVLRSTSDGSKWYQRVTWRIPRSKVLDYGSQVATVTPKEVRGESQRADDDDSFAAEDLRFDYSIEGDARFRPINVFDNGKMVWLRMPPNLTELPVVFAREDDQLVLVNYVPRGDILLVQRMVDELVLKIGKKQVVVRKNVKKGFFSSLFVGGDANVGTNVSGN